MRDHITEFGVPFHLATPMSVVLPPLEATLALCVLLGVIAPVAGAALAALSVAFGIGMISVLSRGLTVGCGCFGGTRESIVSWKLVVRNLVLAILGISIAYAGPGAHVPAWPNSPLPLIVAFAILLALAWRPAGHRPAMPR